MTRSWERNIDGLRSHAQRKAVETAQRAEEATARLLREQRHVNFKTVAETAGISTAWLYGNETLKQRIMHLQLQQVPAVQVKIPQREQASNASKDAMIGLSLYASGSRNLKRRIVFSSSRCKSPMGYSISKKSESISPPSWEFSMRGPIASQKVLHMFDMNTNILYILS